MMKIKKPLYHASQCLIFATALGVVAWSSRAPDWRPIPLVLLLCGLALAAQRMVVQLRRQTLTASFIALTLAMVLLGPGPAVVFGLIACISHAWSQRLRFSHFVTNVFSYTVFLTFGSSLVRLLGGNVHLHHFHGPSQLTQFAVAVFVVFIVTSFLNFLLVAIDIAVLDGDSLMGQVRHTFGPILPGQMATGALAAMLAVAYTQFGYSVLLGLVLVLVIFQYLTAALLRSEERADQIEARSIRLASLQLGVLVTLVETLALRDRAAARHAAAVARLSRALAAEMGCSEVDQDLAHSAGLLHDIGKFALPDRLLHATTMSEDDRVVIRRHPQDGATLVGRLDGYGPVADVILHHHENVNGTGYPIGLIGTEIPLLSRVLAVANAYDSLTVAKPGFATQDPLLALADLRRRAGQQLDGELVERFIEMMGREGQLAALDGNQANFEAELAFERRARTLAQPALA